jgi:Uma2 family endonuclease
MLELETRPMTWQDVLDDPSLQDLPYKIELDGKGRILMSPVTRFHALFQARFIELLMTLKPNGLRISECPVQTRLGVRVPDAAWISHERNAIQTGNVFSVAPEICVEILSPSNTAVEMLEKSALYFEAGAVEVWTCDLQGNVKFFAPAGELERSVLVPNFPLLITV